jgi:hypothetical protein
MPMPEGTQFSSARQLLISARTNERGSGENIGYDREWGFKPIPLRATPKLRQEKLEQAKSTSQNNDWVSDSGETLYDSIKRQGVQSPIEFIQDIHPSYLAEGHHRLIAAHDIDPNMMIPYRVYKTYEEFEKNSPSG